MTPGWKVARELSRIGQQLRGIAERLTDPAAQRRLDRLVAQGLPRLDGALALTGKVALYLVHQPAGLADSTLDTCRHLQGCGYAPLVVSNAPLSAADRARLAPVVWRAVERPNFGYDFGGYRDGLTCLRQWGVAPGRLLILNDSVWFPVLPGSDLVERLETAPADIAGTVLRERRAERFLESYLYAIRGPVLDHPAFRAYWNGLRLTSNKYHVIRRGERGFSAAMLAAGLHVQAVYSADSFLRAAAAADESVLRTVLRFAAHQDPVQQAALRKLSNAPATPDFRADALAAIRSTLAKAQFYSTFPVGAVVWLGYPLAKKSRDPVNANWRVAWLNAIDAGLVAEPRGAILAEARRAAASDEKGHG